MNRYARRLYEVLRGVRRSRLAPIERFDMAYWGLTDRRVSAHVCGSAHCIGGTGEAMFHTVLIKTYKKIHELLGLTYSVKEALFFPMFGEGLEPRLHQDAIWGVGVNPYEKDGRKGARRAAAALRRACVISNRERRSGKV